MKHELADIRAWAYVMGMPAFVIALATPVLLAIASLLSPNLIWLCYLMPVVLASVRWGFASAAAAAVTAGLVCDFFFTQPYYSLYMEDRSDVAALLVFLLAAFGSALVITNRRQEKHGGLTSSSSVPMPAQADIDARGRELVEAAVTAAAISFSELAQQEAIAAAADRVSDPQFSRQWRSSLTTILGAASVVLMRDKFGANRLERTLLTDIRDEAMRLSQLLTEAFPAPRATVPFRPIHRDRDEVARPT
jgi:K+-sensing histidine kinase KdpD